MAKPRALILTTIQGHASIAQAVSEGLEQAGWQTHTASYPDPALVIYRWIYRYAPQLCKYYYKALFLPGVSQLIAAYTKSTHRPTFKAVMEEFPTDIIISVSYGFDSLLTSWKAERRKNNQPSAPYLNMVVDPRTFFPVDLCPGADLNCVFDEATAQRAQHLQPHTAVAATGWFVRQQFRNKAPKEVVRKELQLDPHKLTLLFAAGSEGEVKSAKLIPALLELNQPVQIVLACGSNVKLKQAFDQLVAEIPDDSPAQFQTLSFTKELYKYIHAADLIIGKAGPNMIFEAVAAETPFMATTHIAGQEDGNLDLIREYQIGFVQEDLSRAAALLKKIVQNPQELHQFEPHLKKLAQFNDQSMEKLLQLITKLKA